MLIKRFLDKFWPLFVLLLLTTFIAWPIFLPGFFSHHDDLQVMRIFEMKRCLLDLQIPCRWVPDLGYGLGYPLFNYYGVFPYYIGAITSFFLGFIGSAKLLFFIAVSGAGLSMFFLAKELLGTYPALLAAILYMFAPYRALDIYVRGALSESFSIAIIPLIFYFAFKLISKNLPRFRIGLTLSFAAFLTSHNIMTLIFLPVICMVLFIWFWKRQFTVVKSLIVSMLLGFGLSAFFIIPAYWERNLVQIENLVRGEFDFRGHFVSLYQLFLDRFWGYGASFSGVGDTISFQIGWPHYFLVIASIFTLFLTQRKNLRLFALYLSLTLVFLVSIFMTHVRSAFVWEQIDLLRFVQFPWRFLSIAIFSSSLIGGFLIYSLNNYLGKITVVLLVALTVFLNWSYFKPKEFDYNISDKEKLSGKLWEIQQRASILDYLPIGAVEAKEPAKDLPIIKGVSDIEYFKKHSNYWDLKINVKSTSQVTLPVFDFPNWQVFKTGKIYKHSKDEIGRITILLEPGQHLIQARFGDTLIRIFSNIVTLVSAVIILYISFYGKIRKIFK